MTVKIEIPVIYHTSKHCQSLLEIWQTVSQKLETSLDLTLDFQKCSFLSHLGVAFLGGLSHHVRSKGGQLNFDWDTLQPKVHTNLAQNGFLFSFEQGIEPWNGNSIPYRQDLDQNKCAIVEYLVNQWLGKNWVDISSGLKGAIVGTVWEIYTNAFEHSNSSIGVFSCGQYYPNKKELHLTIIDFGQGIANNVRSLPQNRSLDAAQSLEWAFQTGNSTVTKIRSRGMGLSTLQNFLSSNRGNLKIFSNDGYINIKDSNVVYEKRVIDFQGTMINIAFKCDESFYYLASEVNSGVKKRF
jgi:anti-anti-sigma regulatory factor